MKILLVYPEFPDTFWSFKHALKFIFKKAGSPPLGLLTVAAILPDEWEKKLIDMNINRLNDVDLRWADFVFVSGIAIQKESAKKVIGRCKAAGVKIVAGGPLFTTGYQEFMEIDHFILNEAEITLPIFLKDLKNGCARHMYTTDRWADIKKTPLPRWELINMKRYASINIQYSRGCPFHCEFCDIALLCGRVPRTKDKMQVLRELESLYALGWRESVFFVDDNFIANKKKLKNEILPAIAEWMERKKHPFSFITQASIELADDEELMKLMAKAGFVTVFIGIETPHEMSLAECSKVQNMNRDLLACVKKIQKFGLQVQGGFIVGFDNDPPTIFDSQIKFIQKSGIVIAMVGLLNALPKTRLYQRLEKENRLLKDSTGDNTDFSINFIPKMNYDLLISGYKKILNTVYSPKYYYERVKTFLREYVYPQKRMFQLSFNNLCAFLKSILFLGIIGQERVHYWRLVFWTVFRRPRLFPLALTFAIYGFHFRKIFEKYTQFVQLTDIRQKKA
ncbi:MAG: B12-binding domain-containing radical SAM protein [Thermodesulfovibrio sp.]|nr:B12-binding domain-containing radical SAM protein [Thermodesulfovibrio sp.]